jgi:hypothetical protein
MPKKRKKMAQISLRIDAHLKEAAETAATEDHRSLTSLVEQLLASHIRRRHVLSMSRRPSKEAARAAFSAGGARSREHRRQIGIRGRTGKPEATTYSRAHRISRYS